MESVDRNTLHFEHWNSVDMFICDYTQLHKSDLQLTSDDCVLSFKVSHSSGLWFHVPLGVIKDKPPHTFIPTHFQP